MEYLKTQFGVSSEADFEKSTWKFDMPKDFSVTAGEFAIIPKEQYKELIEIASRIIELGTKL